MDMSVVRPAIEEVIRRAASVDGAAVSVNTLHGDDLRAFALRALEAATLAKAEAESYIAWMADEARATGATWQQIGDAHGVSRQWAHKRFHDNT